MIVDDCSAYVKLKYPGMEIVAERELIDENNRYLECIILDFIEKNFGK